MRSRYAGLAILACLVAAALSPGAINLTSWDATGSAVAAIGGTFIVKQAHSSGINGIGSGSIDSFLRINSNDPSEQGYNTSLFGGQNGQPPLNDVGGNWTHAIL